jgi:hypothetical protein
MGVVLDVPRTRIFKRNKEDTTEIVLGDQAEVDVVKWLDNEFITKDVGLL